MKELVGDNVGEKGRGQNLMECRVHTYGIRIKSEVSGKVLMDFRQEHAIDILNMSQTWSMGKLVTVGQDYSGDLLGNRPDDNGSWKERMRKRLTSSVSEGREGSSSFPE